jgi:uncharacterized protein
MPALFEPSADWSGVLSALRGAAIYIALIALMGVALAVNAARMRYRARIGLGDGHNPQLLSAMRIHGNLIEQATLGLPILIAAPFVAVPAALIHGLGVMLVIGRVAHVIGLTQSPNRSVGRVLGMALSWTMLILGAIILLGYAAFAPALRHA